MIKQEKQPFSFFSYLGSRMQTRSVRSPQYSVCYSFALSQSKKKSCVQEVSQKLCPSQRMPRDLDSPITISIETVRDRDNNPSFNFFTQFKLEYTFEYCFTPTAARVGEFVKIIC